MYVVDLPGNIVLTSHNDHYVKLERKLLYLLDNNAIQYIPGVYVRVFVFDCDCFRTFLYVGYLYNDYCIHILNTPRVRIWV